MGITMARVEGKRVYRVSRRIKKEHFTRDFPADRKGYLAAEQYDKELCVIQETQREEKTKEFADGGKIKGFFFYTKLANDLSVVKAKFSLNRSTKEFCFSTTRCVKPGETIESVFQELREKYCQILGIDDTNPEIAKLFDTFLKKCVKEYEDMHDVLFLERDKKRRG